MCQNKGKNEHTDLSEQEIISRQSLDELRRLGIDPYPAAEFPVNTSSVAIKSGYSSESASFHNVSIAGRLMSKRIMGSASFAELQDEKGVIQIYLKRDDICPGEDKTWYNIVFKKLLDIGDFIGVKGFVFITQMGEISIHIREITLLGKSLKPLPIVKEKGRVVYDAVTDPEFRYRQRYVDLLVNPGVREIFVKRTQDHQFVPGIIQFTRLSRSGNSCTAAHTWRSRCPPIYYPSQYSGYSLISQDRQ